jgi:hypothetical protein
MKPGRRAGLNLFLDLDLALAPALTLYSEPMNTTKTHFDDEKPFEQEQEQEQEQE